jgi:hypothetical protein
LELLPVLPLLVLLPVLPLLPVQLAEIILTELTRRRCAPDADALPDIVLLPEVLLPEPLTP